jgi:microcystin-dependent protein
MMAGDVPLGLITDAHISPSANISSSKLNASFNPGVGIGTTTPSTKAALDVSSTTQGFLPPRMTSAQRNAISSPPAGLQIFNADRRCLEFYTGAEWSSPTPAGTIQTFGGGTVPDGWLLCDGSAVSRTTYGDLYAKVGTAWGAGNGSSTFHLPDLRGRFLRGRDGGVGRDPDRGSRTASNSGGSAGDNVGSVQSGQVTSHSHDPGSLYAATDGEHQHTWNGYWSCPSGTGRQLRSRLPASGDPTDDVTNAGEGAHTHAITGFTGPTGGNETRPLNAYVNYIIKY